MAEAVITLKLTPSEFNAVQDALQSKIQHLGEDVEASTDPRFRQEAKQEAAVLTLLLDKLS